MTIVQASIGSFIVFLTIVDCVGPTYPTYLVDRLLGKVKTKNVEDSDDDDGKPMTDDTERLTMRGDSTLYSRQLTRDSSGQLYNC